MFPAGARPVATSQTLTVRGFAADSDGVASVRVNGTPATVVRASAAASKRQRIAKGELGEDPLEWSVELNLETGENEISVAIEDDTGEVSEDVASSTILYLEVPVGFEIDTTDGYLVGESFTLGPTGYLRRLVRHNYVTGEQEIFGRLQGTPTGKCLRAAEDQYIYMSLSVGDVRELRKYDLSTREDEVMFEIPSTAFDPGPGFLPGLFTGQLACDSDHTSAYLLVNYVLEPEDDEPIGGFEKSRVLEIPLDGSPIEVLTETDTSEIQPWIATKMELTADTLIAEQSYGATRALTSISLSSGARQELAPDVPVAGSALAPALDVDRVYVATFAGVDEVDVVNSHKRNISEVDSGHPLTFAQPRSIGVDLANHRVLVGDESLEAVIAIDLSTGERTPLVARNVGAGTPLIAPRAFEVTADGLRAYVADFGGNAPARFFEIDLTTGDRTEVGQIRTALTTGHIVTGLALDEEGGHAYISSEEVIIDVDLQTGHHDVLLSTSDTDLESITDILLDLENGRLFILDAVVDGIYTLDLVTRDLNVVSQDGSRGAGPAFGAGISMTRVGTTNELYVAGQEEERITRVDLESGDREELLHGCTDTLGSLRQVFYNEGRDELLIGADRIYSFDRASEQCTQLPTRMSTLQLRVTPDDRMMAVWFRAFVQIDRETGEAAILSK